MRRSPTAPITSIIIPTYNSGQFLAWTVDSIRAQTLDAWELLLVDDGSTDDTLVRAREWAADDSRISVLRQQHGGPNRARNLGFDACDPASKAVIFLDHDDVWEKDALTSLQAALDTHPRAAAAYGIAYHIDTNGAEYDAGLEAWTRNRLAVNGKRVERVPADIATTFEVLAIGNRIPTPGQVLIRRSALGQAGLWDASTAAAADYDLWLRLSLVGDLVFIDRRVIAWRQHDRNFSKNRAVVEDSGLVVRRKFAFDPTLAEELRNALLIGYRYTQVGLARLRLEWAKGCFLRGDVVNGLKQLRHAALALARSVRGLSPVPAR